MPSRKRFRQASKEERVPTFLGSNFGRSKRVSNDARQYDLGNGAGKGEAAEALDIPRELSGNPRGVQGSFQETEGIWKVVHKQVEKRNNKSKLNWTTTKREND